ncbi:putative oligopeptide transporter, OPT family [Peptoclostridium litorale DSM 5388]|uniref:Putative oligopeptide transporter n=1 Tax=Peptoclostridium litorale DSM 5388 TaxID=1121324 RepID=A0A069RHY4_PEPLI|nr:oligopeptide transporter, OPT family [Peptoclostridium litorale]KDR96609.1 putative oligopeptide transporter [Peptoclostridium litorale DSM 5388]SIN68511.1 putative oligopeptide transporter, OPT family [Peptoclostridium litorale DSM 5388]
METQLKKQQKDTEFKPFISADRVLPEFTGTSIILGILLAVIFGGANAYLGLKVGMTISASIPAAVISMGIIRGVLKKESILENNMVQTIGSAGESLAAGAIFTLPALYIWTQQEGMPAPSLMTITVIALCGGILGVLFMVPLRKALIVKEHGVLPYPEGTACAEVLLAGEEGGDKAAACFTGLGIGALYKFIAGGFGLFPSEIETTIPGYKDAAIGADVLPALLGVGFIIGPKISAYMLSGAVISWFGLIPLISNIGSIGEVVMYPASVPISELGYWGIWNNYIRYVGAGAVAFGGIYNLIKTIPLIVQTFKDTMKDYSSNMGERVDIRTDRDMSMKLVLIGSLAVVAAMAMLPIIPVGIGGALIIAVFGFFFATVSSRIVGLVGSSSNPVSGMTIATLIITAIIFKATGNDGLPGMIATLSVGAVICIIAAMSGDTSQDLKTGFLVGATPVKQQIGELIGAVSAALAIGAVLTLLNNAWGFGSQELPAPQATLMRLVIEGVMGGNLPWSLVFTGMGMGVAIELLGLPVLPIAIGMYLPIHLSTPIMLGGIIRGILDKRAEKSDANQEEIKEKIDSGILYASGLIAGEGLVGIMLAVLTVVGINTNLGIDLGQLGALVAFGLLTFSLAKYSVFKKVS